jgi:site-specific DNA-methyltransferase (adenine-specific)
LSTDENIRYRLFHDDALAVLMDLPDASVDAIVTDPPYSSGGRRENARSLRKSMVREMTDDEWIAGDAMSTPGFIWLMREVGRQARRVLIPGGHFLSFIDWRMAANLSAALESADLRVHPTLVWDKQQIGMGAIFRNQHEFIVHMTNGNPVAPQRRDVANVLSYAPIRSGEHPTQKPVPLMRTLVSVVCPKGGLVVDPFMGSGTTGVAALLEGCRFIGAEVGDYYAAAEGRLSAVANGYRDDGAQGDLFGGAA